MTPYVLTFLFIGATLNSGILAWQLAQSRFEASELRAQNERLIARLGVEMGFHAGAPREPVPIPVAPPTPAPMFAFRRPLARSEVK